MQVWIGGIWIGTPSNASLIEPTPDHALTVGKFESGNLTWAVRMAIQNSPDDFSAGILEHGIEIHSPRYWHGLTQDIAELYPDCECVFTNITLNRAFFSGIDI